MRKAASVTITVLGLVVLSGAAVARGAVAPMLSALPAHVDTTRTYSGTAATLLDPAAIAAGAIDKVVRHDVPITVQHRDRVLSASFTSALVADSKTVKANGTTIADITYRYAVDRRSLGLGYGYSGLTSQQGLTFNWPIMTGSHDYPGWVADTQRSAPLRFRGTQQHAGVATDVFTISTEPAVLRDPQVLSALPQAMPKGILTALAPQLGLAAVPANLPELVRLAYTYRVDATYWVAPRSGIVVDVTQREVRSVGIANAAGLPTVTAPVMAIAFTSTPATLKAAVTDARNASRSLELINTTLPLVLLLGGLLLLGSGVVLLKTRKANPAPTPAQDRTPIGVS